MTQPPSAPLSYPSIRNILLQSIPSVLQSTTPDIPSGNHSSISPRLKSRRRSMSISKPHSRSPAKSSRLSRPTISDRMVTVEHSYLLVRLGRLKEIRLLVCSQLESTLWERYRRVSLRSLERIISMLRMWVLETFFLGDLWPFQKNTPSLSSAEVRP